MSAKSDGNKKGLILPSKLFSQEEIDKLNSDYEKNYSNRRNVTNTATKSGTKEHMVQPNLTEAITQQRSDQSFQAQHTGAVNIDTAAEAHQETCSITSEGHPTGKGIYGSNSNKIEQDLKHFLKQAADGFTSVKSKRKRRKVEESAKTGSSNVDVYQNKFALLADAEVMDIEGDNEVITQTNSNKNVISDRTINVGTNIKTNLLNQSKSHSFCPPIFVFGVNTHILTEIVKSTALQLNITNYNLKFTNLEYLKTKIFVNHTGLHKKLVDLFRNSEIDAFSFTPKEARKPTMLVKGIDGDTPIEIVKQALIDKAPDVKITNISHFSTPNSRKIGIPLNTFTVQTETEEDMKKLINIKYLLLTTIHWERKRAQKIIRCFRCQRFGHTGEYCAYDPRCSICGEKHNSEICIAIEKDRRPVTKCANCQSTEHTAGYGGCPELQKYKTKRESMKNKIKERIANRTNPINSLTNTYVNPMVTYASILRRNNGQTKEQVGDTGSNELKEFLNESNNLFKLPFHELIRKIREFWPKYKAMESQGEKAFAYLQFAASIIG